ncbi:protein lin-54 homolog, partial [Cydia strobilella]|uniref:protein lin-54 homolog n=1 Tax=Cydia strobilella TaxID=1100964 RepID=UPI003004CD5C
MDHNLDDSLNLDSAMGVDFEPPGDVVVSQADISLDAHSHEANMSMEFESIEEQPMLMDAESEQIIGYSDDQFNLQDFQHHDDHTGANTTVVSSEQPMSQANTLLDMQFDQQVFTSTAPVEIKPQHVQQPKIISVKAGLPQRIAAKKEPVVVHAMPRQVAIAPKPVPKTLGLKPLTLASARSPQLVKKVSIASVTGTTQGKSVLAQIGKQLVMVPGTNQKIKLVAAPSGVSNIQYIRANPNDHAQLITTKNISGAKPMLTKFIIQGQSGDPSNQPAVITKLVSAAPQARFVTMTQKTVPISMPNKVFVASPTKQTVRITKKQHIVEIKSPNTAKLIPTSQTGGTKKVVITATPTQNVILKTTAPPKTPQVNKDGNITVQGQRTQLHQINVPGKGIQYIRLVTSGAHPGTGTGTGAVRLKPTPTPMPKAVMLTDAKGNVLQMAAEKVQSGQPPPLVISGSTSSININKLSARPQKLVRIAPVGSAPALAAAQQSSTTPRPMQSLLAPLSPAPAPAPALAPAPPPTPPTPAPAPAPAPAHAPAPQDEDAEDSKAALQDLLRAAHHDHDLHSPRNTGVEVEFERQQSEGESRSNSPEPTPESLEPLIVIPNYLKQQEILPDDFTVRDERNSFHNFDMQNFNSYQAPPTPQPVSESDIMSSELGLRPRKACNCTKSQCLKLYCDCFANGEFCHRCNCNNCHNNLENEELRQKAIRGCLDRNPNAFRPKIGKAKSGGPEIVRRHNKGCNCKRSGCLKNYCECYEAKIACTAMCKCVGCRNVEESLARRRDRRDAVFRPQALPHINFMTTEVIEAVTQCLIAAAAEPNNTDIAVVDPDPVRDVIDEFSRCLQDIINAAHHSAPMLDEVRSVSHHRPVRHVIDEFSRCLQDIINAAHHSAPMLDEVRSVSHHRPVRHVIDEFSRCLQDIINAAHHSAPMLDEVRSVSHHRPVRHVIDEFSRCLQDIINAAHHSAPMLDEVRSVSHHRPVRHVIDEFSRCLQDIINAAHHSAP